MIVLFAAGIILLKIFAPNTLPKILIGKSKDEETDDSSSTESTQSTPPNEPTPPTQPTPPIPEPPPRPSTPKSLPEPSKFLNAADYYDLVPEANRKEFSGYIEIVNIVLDKKPTNDRTINTTYRNKFKSSSDSSVTNYDKFPMIDLTYVIEQLLQYMKIPQFKEMIGIDFGCTYDVRNGYIIHNAGPFTDKGCGHPWGDEKKLVADLKKKYPGAIEKHEAAMAEYDRKIGIVSTILEKLIINDIDNVIFSTDLTVWRNVKLPKEFIETWNLVACKYSGGKIYLLIKRTTLAMLKSDAKELSLGYLYS